MNPKSTQVTGAIITKDGKVKQVAGPWTKIHDNYLTPLASGKQPIEEQVVDVPHGETRVAEKGEVLSTDLSHGRP